MDLFPGVTNIGYIPAGTRVLPDRMNDGIVDISFGIGEDTFESIRLKVTTFDWILRTEDVVPSIGEAARKPFVLVRLPELVDVDTEIDTEKEAANGFWVRKSDIHSF